MKDEIYIIGSTAHSLINFRYDLIKYIKKKNSIVALCQDYDFSTYKKLKKIKVKYFSYGTNNFF